MDSTVVGGHESVPSSSLSGDGGQTRHRSIHDLPNELLAEVLIWATWMTHGGSLRQLPPIVFRQVNKHLRTTALKTPELWANIHINLDDLRTEAACVQYEHYLTLAHEASGTCPIHLVILNTSEKEHAAWLNSNLLNAIRKIFRRDSGRIRSLKVCSQTLSLPELDGWLDTVFPRLDDLELDVKDAQKLVRATPKTAPLLRTATIALHHCQASSSVFRFVRRASITPPNSINHHNRQALLKLDDAFRMFPRAVEMDINLTQVDNPRLPSAVIVTNGWSHCNVRVLTIWTRRGFGQATVSYDLPALEVLNIRPMTLAHPTVQNIKQTILTGIWHFVIYAGAGVRHINIELPLTLDISAYNAIKSASRLERLRCPYGKMTSGFSNQLGGVDGRWANLFLTTLIFDGFLVENNDDAAVAFVDAIEARKKAKDEGAGVSKVIKVAVRSWTGDIEGALQEGRLSQQQRLARILSL